ncbi:unnamed protein product [Phytomonas sp. Hart1]|nr:unnamed protein product [Phytomonas sp. Hart1]|eukprot:CCW71612.1 unnamed protein product [Phytomonas sp. isolate Hart1]
MLRRIQTRPREQAEAHQLALKDLGIATSTDGLRIFLDSPLRLSSGIWAFDSDIVFMSRALSELSNRKLSGKTLNRNAFVGERGYHGMPRGLDNTAATFGGLISYQRVSGKSISARSPSSQSYTF